MAEIYSYIKNKLRIWCRIELTSADCKWVAEEFEI